MEDWKINYVESLNQPYEIERCFSDDLVDYHMMQLGKNRTWVISSPALKQKIINFDPFAEIIDCQEKVQKDLMILVGLHGTVKYQKMRLLYFKV